MGMTVTEINSALGRIKLPSFVRRVSAVTGAFDKFRGVGRDYCLQVELTNREPDMYHNTGPRLPLTNNPFDFPADEGELRAQVATAVLMGVAHETFEQISDGGLELVSPHRFKGGSPEDTKQWLALLGGLHGVVRRYAAKMPA